MNDGCFAWRRRSASTCRSKSAIESWRTLRSRRSRTSRAAWSYSLGRFAVGQRLDLTPELCFASRQGIQVRGAGGGAIPLLAFPLPRRTLGFPAPPALGALLRGVEQVAGRPSAARLTGRRVRRARLLRAAEPLQQLRLRLRRAALRQAQQQVVLLRHRQRTEPGRQVTRRGSRRPKGGAALAGDGQQVGADSQEVGQGAQRRRQRGQPRRDRRLHGGVIQLAGLDGAQPAEVERAVVAAGEVRPHGDQRREPRLPRFIVPVGLPRLVVRVELQDDVLALHVGGDAVPPAPPPRTVAARRLGIEQPPGSRSIRRCVPQLAKYRCAS